MHYRDALLRLRALLFRREMDRDLGEELQFHLEMQARKNCAANASLAEARRQARLQFGSVERATEECREARGISFIEVVLQDTRYAVRTLRKSPAFTTAAVLTLALGIGANTAIFTLIDGILLKPLPYRNPDQLIDLNHTAPGVNFSDADAAPFLYFTYREQGRAFQSVGLYRFDSRTVTRLAEPEEVQCLNVTAEVLPMLGVQPILGRWFSEKDATPGSPSTAILTYEWWQERFGGDRFIIRRQIVVNGILSEVIGVMPANFRFLDRDAALILPLQFNRNKAILGEFDYPGIARLKPGVSIQEASADVARMIPIALHSFPPSPGLTVKEFEQTRLAPKLEFFKQKVIGDLGKTLWVLMGTLGIVLLIACANIANLLLARAEGRRQEMAIRAALGAGWRDLARQLLVESVVLGLVGGALGLGLADGSVRMLIATSPLHLPRLSEISINPAVVLFSLVIALATGVLFGMLPVVKYATPRIVHALQSGNRLANASRDRSRVRSVLVVVQVGLALVLLVASGLMIRTFHSLRRVDPGFDPRDVLTLRISIPASQVHDPVAAIQLEQAMLEKIAAIAGVSSAGMSSVIPTEAGGSDLVYARDKTYSQSVPPLRRMNFISPGLLAAMGNRLIAGREFTWTDTYERRPVAMVSENLARELWQDPQAALGKEIREDLKRPWRQVIGVVNDVHEDGLQESAPTTAYYPLLMSDFENHAVAERRTVYYVVRSKRAGSPALLADVQSAIRSLNPNLPLARIRTLQEIYDRSLARTSFVLVMLAIAGAMALFIGLVGIYGVISYAVSQRTREIGVRMALGAQPQRILAWILGQGAAMVISGVVIGTACALLLTRFLSSMLFGVRPQDPLTYTIVVLMLGAIALLACYLPARRATRVEPMAALRRE